MLKLINGKIKLILIIAIVLVVIITGGSLIYLSGLGASDSEKR